MKTSSSFASIVSVIIVNAVAGSMVACGGVGESGSTTGRGGTTLPFPLCTNVYDANNHLLLGVDVTYTVATGGGSIEGPATVATDGRGIATSGLWTLGPNGGAQTVTATAASGVTVTFRAVAN